MSTLSQEQAAVIPEATPEAAAIRSLVFWRRRDREHLADKGDRDKQRAEYRARQELRGVADHISKAAGEP